MFRLRTGSFSRVPDAVVWPNKHADVEKIVSLAHEHNVCLIPFGGGTSVTNALQCPSNESRMIVSVDMKDMNRIKWIDKENMMGCFETGIVGKDLEAKLLPSGLCLGHEPDSLEFSTLGGWIATRASGMKKNTYGNIEDLLVHLTIVTPSGTMAKNCKVPRISSGPDLHEMVLGSEGIFGIITEAVLILRPLPQVKKYGSIVFPDFETGVAFMRDVAMTRSQPDSEADGQSSISIWPIAQA